MNMKLRMLVALVITLGVAASVMGLINPSFTPCDLVEQSDTILELEIKKVDDKGLVVVSVKKVIKGEFESKEIKIDLEASILAKAAGGKLKEFVGKGQKQALLFIGMFQAGDDDMGGGGMDEEAKGFLHIAGEVTDNNQNEWFVLDAVPDDISAWDMSKLDSKMLGTWNGSTAMLIKVVKYCMEDEGAVLPSNSGVSWDAEVRLAKLSGKVTGIVAVDLTSKDAKGKSDLFVACVDGDRILRLSGKTGQDMTGKCKLTSKSHAFAWGDFNIDGRIDLASFDGKALSLHTQQADGTFTAGVIDIGAALKGGCISLTTVDSGVKGRPALVAATKASPVVITFAADGKATAKAVVAGDFPGKVLGATSVLLAADFDSDGKADLVQMFPNGGLFYKGQGGATFAAPVKTLIAAGEDKAGASLGDYDADGLIDIFVVADDRNRLWHNVGGGKFLNMLVVSGEIFYHPKPGGIASDTGDFNNDGRQDVLIAYHVQQKPHLFFNRGWRSFGHAYMVDLDEQKLLDQAGDGQQTACFGDFNGDGALDMILVLTNGEVWCFPRKIEEGPALAVRPVLPLGGDVAGPVIVRATKDDWSYGAFVVRAGEPGPLVGMQRTGPVVLKWLTPDGKEHTKTVFAQGGPVRAELSDKK
jgi:VCBS repeat protein